MPDNPKIIFVFPQELGDFVYHLGTSYIIAYLKEKGIYAQQFAGSPALPPVGIAAKILEKKPLIIGFTVYDANYFLVKELAKAIKLNSPETTILAGGPTATFSAKQIIKDSGAIDICVRGEGEIAVFELIERLSLKEELGSVSGITYRNGEKIISTCQRPLLSSGAKEASLDILPSPYLSGAINIKEMIRLNHNQAPILTSRGCIYNCTYCNFSAMSRHKVRFHSPQRIISELRILDTLRRNGLDFEVSICDDAFTLNKERIRRICEAIIKEGIKLRIIGAQVRADTVDRGLLKLLFKAGVREVNFGLESSSPRILYNVRKARLNSSKTSGFKPEKQFIQKVKDSAVTAKKIGFETLVSVIFGLPGDTEKRAKDTLNFVNNLRVDGYSHNILNIHSGTALARNYKRYGIKKIKTPYSFLSHPMLSPLTFPYDANKLPRLKNERNIGEQRKLSLSFLTNSITGMYKKEKAYLYPEVVFVTGGDFPHQWLKSESFFQTRFIYGIGLEFNREGITLTAAAQTSCFHPKYELFSANKLFSLLPEELKFGFHFDCLKNVKGSIQNKRCIYSIEDGIDVLKLKELSCDNANSYDFGFFGRLNKDYLILDGCRWSSFCPALNLHRLFIDGNDNIRVCRDSRVIGKTGDALQVLKKRIDKAYEEKIQERGCNGCPVKSSCSKCPFLKPEIEEIYCQARRNNLGINYFINSFQLARKIDYFCDAENKEIR
jgi:anaerobic magnesium-protoporphyrin IX monomethyl ester cyclase